MSEIYFDEFRLIVIEQIRDIEQSGPETHSMEWFLLKYLRRIEMNARTPTTLASMENSMRALIRFYVDMIDEDSQLGDRCKMIYENYRRITREAQAKN